MVLSLTYTNTNTNVNQKTQGLAELKTEYEVMR